MAVMSQCRTVLSRGGTAGWGRRRARTGRRAAGLCGRTWRCGAGMEAQGSAGHSTEPWPPAPRHGGVTAGRPPPAVFPPHGPMRPSQAWRSGNGVGTAAWPGAAPLHGPHGTAPVLCCSPGHGWLSIARIAPLRLLPHSVAPSPVQRSTIAWISHCTAPSVHASLCTAVSSPIHSSISFAELCPRAQLPLANSYRTAPQCTALNCTDSYCMMPSILHCSPVNLIAQLHIAWLPSHCTAPFPLHSSLMHSSPVQQC